MIKTIVTYFEPFNGRSINASKELVLGMSNDFEKVSVPVSWKKSMKVLDEIIKKEPTYLFLVGEAIHYRHITVEIVAKNFCAGPDEDGEVKPGERILKATPKFLKTNFNIDPNKYHTSKDAGSFLCNYMFYVALLRAEVTKVVFIHVPDIKKGQKEKLTEELERIITSIIDDDNSTLIRLKNRIKEVNDYNAIELYHDIKKEYHLPNIIIGTTFNEDGSFALAGRADGYKGIWYEYGSTIIDQLKGKRSLYYKIFCYLYNLSEEQREDDTLLEKTRYFSYEEYIGASRAVRQYMNGFISRAKYTSEIEFHQSIDDIYLKLIRTTDGDIDSDALYAAKDYVSRLGLDRCREILHKLLNA